MKTRNLYIAIIMSMFMLTGCDQHDLIPNYIYNKLSIKNIESLESFYILDLQGCDYCIQTNLDFLKQKKLNLNSLILVGTTKNLNWLESISLINSEYNIVEDRMRLATKLGIDLTKPLLVITKEQYMLKKINIDENELQNIEPILESLSNK